MWMPPNQNVFHPVRSPDDHLRDNCAIERTGSEGDVEVGEGDDEALYNMSAAADIAWTVVFSAMIICAIVGNIAVFWIVLGKYKMASKVPMTTSRILYLGLGDREGIIQLCSISEKHFASPKISDQLPVNQRRPITIRITIFTCGASPGLWIENCSAFICQK